MVMSAKLPAAVSAKATGRHDHRPKHGFCSFRATPNRFRRRLLPLFEPAVR